MFFVSTMHVTQNHRMIWAEKVLTDHLIPTPSHRQGHLPTQYQVRPPFTPAAPAQSHATSGTCLPKQQSHKVVVLVLFPTAAQAQTCHECLFKHVGEAFCCAEDTDLKKKALFHPEKAMLLYREANPDSCSQEAEMVSFKCLLKRVSNE